ncbi:hypothetical protein BRYFOR_07949 [Marvinbryantia formatexigens DSM 14469]|uniref:Uncharacterized protein n=1 Tax=Marvinbryantia formatexigens DSM 14469 TaxID=478749 RepID=C6LH39_9FIRM|nr:hypothetical protein BRYFOR_07949 [Marvinbryantia formatexigens DSM 14469]
MRLSKQSVNKNPANLKCEFRFAGFMPVARISSITTGGNFLQKMLDCKPCL